MDYDKMWRELNRRKMLDPEYQECLERVNALEPEYLRIRDALTPEDRETLEDYIAACEELGDLMTVLAYGMRAEG